MKVAEALIDLNDPHICAIWRCFSKLRYIDNVHFCLLVNIYFTNETSEFNIGFLNCLIMIVHLHCLVLLIFQSTVFLFLYFGQFPLPSQGNNQH